jgi:hypothetical protein
MVAKLVLDQLEKTGGSLNALTLPASNATANQYLQDNGSGVLSWSTVTAGGVTNIKHTASATVTLVEADVSGKSSLVVSVDPSGGNMIVNLPALGTTGLSSCIITVVSRADATSTFSLIVKDSAGTEVWTGYQKNDFITLCESNSAWLVVDHKETYFSHRWLTATTTIGTSATTKITGWTLVKEVGNAWDNSNNKLTTPTGMNGYWNVSYNDSASTETTGITPTLYIGGSSISQYAHAYGTSGYLAGQNGVTGRYYATSTQDVEFYATNIRSDYTHTIGGGGISTTHFTAQFERVY